MKNWLVSIVFILLTASSAAIMLMPRDEASFEAENRSAAELPNVSFTDILSGKFASDFEKFVDDNISFRSEIMDLSEYVNSYKGITPPDGEIIYTQKDIGTQTVKKASLLLLDKQIKEVFTKDEEAELAYINCINSIAEAAPPDVNIYSMIVPTSLEFTEAVYRNIQSSQKKTIDYIYESLDPRIKKVDAYSVLQNHSDEYIYFGSDHHWTMLGSYYGYSAFMQAQGVAPASRESFQKNTIENFYGHLSAEVSKSKIEADTIEWWDTEEVNEISTQMYGFDNGNVIEYQSPLLDKKKTDYSLFLASDHPMAVITNNRILNDRTLVIIKDSYANVFVPWLVNNYRTIVMLDPRGFEGSVNDVLLQYNANDLLIMNYIFTTTFTDYSDLLEEMK